MAYSAHAERPRFDIADIVRRHRAELEASENLTLPQRRVLSAIALCRTAALGGHVDVCRSCGYMHPAYNSCRNRHCPKCQALAQEKWIAARAVRLVPVRHFHVVFTVPSELRRLCQFRSQEMFHALFTAASETLAELGESRLQARLGITMVLHTWTRDLRFHPHVHALVTAGGLALDGSQWAPSNAKYLFPVKVMGTLLRGKMLDALRTLHNQGSFEGFEAFSDPEGFDRLMAQLARTPWIVYAKKPFRRSDHVLKYLGRYTHRVAIANSRLVNVTEQSVTFRTKNGESVTLAPAEFLRRFVQHVLPPGFHKIRHYGLYAAAHAETLDQAREVLSPKRPTSATADDSPKTTAPMPSWQERLRILTGRDVAYCRRCGAALEHLPVPRSANLSGPSERAPPEDLAV